MLHFFFINMQKVNRACEKLLRWFVAKKEVIILFRHYKESLMHTIEQLDILIDDYLHSRMQLRYVKENHAKNGRHRELSNINKEFDDDAISRKFLLVYNRKNNEDLYD